MTRIIKSVLLTLLLTAVFVQVARAQGTYTAASCNYSDVNAVINGPTHVAITGDTINIPAGSCTWGNNNSGDTGLSVSVGISIIGAGPSSTIITDNEYKGSAGCGGPFVPLIDSLQSSNVSVRISGFQIIGEAPAGDCSESYSHIIVEGVSHQVRIDHIEMNPLTVTGILVKNDSQGVADHNTFIEPQPPINKPFPFEIQADEYGSVGNYGDNSWAQADTQGTGGAWYIESNTFVDTNTGQFPTGCFDSSAGGRLVFRFNTGCPYVAVHGTESGFRLRSARQWEIYDNTFTAMANPLGNMYTGVFLRGGTGKVFSNNFVDISGYPYEQLVILVNYRSTNNDWPPWGVGYNGIGCDGRSPYDTNIGTAYVTGTYNGGGGTTEIMTDTTQSWSTNQWVGYSVVNLTKGWGSAIDSSTATTLTTESAAQGTPHAWTTGDSYEINKAYPCIDQIGRGAGLLVQDLVSGDEEPVLQSTGNPGAVTEASDPVYEWLNQHNGSTVTTTFHVDTPAQVVQNRDYYDYTTSFNGTSGVGSGTLASRPSTCTTGVGYWATDQGNWNQSGSGGQGVLYTCTATNTWTATYTPYTYPHPLTLAQSAGNPPAPPTALTATVN